MERHGLQHCMFLFSRAAGTISSSERWCGAVNVEKEGRGVCQKGETVRGWGSLAGLKRRGLSPPACASMNKSSHIHTSCR